MATVVAARDEKEKERRDASCAPARAKLTAHGCSAPRPRLSKAQMFQDKNIGSVPLVGWKAGRRDFAPDFANLLLYATKSGPTNPVSKWRKNG
jgi:hypothetical protein